VRRDRTDICCFCSNTSRREQPNRAYIQLWEHSRTRTKSRESMRVNRRQRHSQKQPKKLHRPHEERTKMVEVSSPTNQTFRLAHTHPRRRPSLQQLPPSRKCPTSQPVVGPYQAKSSFPSASLGVGLSHGSGYLPSQHQSQNG